MIRHTLRFSDSGIILLLDWVVLATAEILVPLSFSELSYGPEKDKGMLIMLLCSVQLSDTGSVVLRGVVGFHCGLWGMSVCVVLVKKNKKSAFVRQLPFKKYYFCSYH